MAIAKRANGGSVEERERRNKAFGSALTPAEREVVAKKHGGSVGDKMSGEKGKMRFDKRARGGRVGSPFSSAHSSKFEC